MIVNSSNYNNEMTNLPTKDNPWTEDQAWNFVIWYFLTMFIPYLGIFTNGVP